MISLSYCQQRVALSIRRCFLLISLGFAFSAKAQYNNILHKTFAQWEAALAVFSLEDIRTGDSATVFKKIDQIRKLAINSDDDELLMETKLMRAGYFYFRSSKFPGKLVLSILDSIRLEAVQKNMLWAELKAETCRPFSILMSCIITS